MPYISPRHPFRLGRSRTGLGLFATKPIAKGSFIIKYWGPKLPNKIADDLDNRYLFEISKRWTVDGSPRRNIARYINHSCRPNAESDVVKGEILITAIKNIAVGDEITYDYGKDHFNGFIKPIGCQCDKCREKRRAERAAARAAKKYKARKAKANGRRRP
jgi:SET domain-containing protein